MKIYEYQAKELFKRYGIPVPRGFKVDTPEEIEATVKQFPTQKLVLKAQVFTGGRGKAGGVKIAEGLTDIIEKGRQILGMKIKNLPVKKLLIEEPVDIEKELYLSFILDRDNACFRMIFSPAGGVDIEEIAAKTPEKILTVSIPFFPGLLGFHLREMLPFVKDLSPPVVKELFKIASNLFKFFIEKEASLAEINPLVITKQGQVLACDGKVIFDDNALFRQKDILELRSPEEDDPSEAEAKSKGLNYVKLEGNIGCMVNGAGLAMATMDVIKHFGGEPANFLDIGGGAKAQQVTDALAIILKDPNVKALFINIFGGIVRCDLVAEGILAAKKTLGIVKPMVIRLIGTNDKKAYEMLEKEGISCFATMAEAAKEVVKKARESKS